MGLSPPPNLAARGTRAQYTEWWRLAGSEGQAEKGVQAMSGQPFELGICLVLTLGAGARAVEQVTLEIRFTHPVVMVGQFQSMEVWAHLSPPVGSLAISNFSGAVSTVLGFAGASFDLGNVLNGETGVFSGLASSPPLNLGLSGVPSANGGVSGVAVGQLGPINNPSFVAQTDLLLWSADWHPSTYTPREVEFVPVGTAQPSVWLNDPTIGHVPDPWEFVTMPASFQVVPATSAVIVLAAGLMCSASRRRWKH